MNPIEIDGEGNITYVVAFFPDGKHIVSGGTEHEIRRWRVKDGQAMGTPTDAGSRVYSLAVSQDGKWIWKAHNHEVRALDGSADSTKITSGSGDGTVCIRSLSTGEQRFRWKLGYNVVAAKYSPDQRLIATAVWGDSVRLCDVRNGSLLSGVPIRVNSGLNCSLVWFGDSKHLFALSSDGNINCIDASAGTTLSQWPIHSTNDPIYISLASNCTFVAATAYKSVSFWDTATHEQIGSVIELSYAVFSMAISVNFDLATAEGKKMFIRSLWNTLPSRYLNNGNSNPEEATPSDDVREETQDLERVIEQLRTQLSESKHVLNQKTGEFDETCKRLRGWLSHSQRALHLKEKELEESLETIQQLCAELACSNGLIRTHEKIDECEILDAEDHTIDAANILHKITDTASKEVKVNKFIMNGLANFTRRCVRKLENLGDAAVDSKDYKVATEYYSSALSFDPANLSEILVKRSNVWVFMNSWDEALADANKTISLDPTPPSGYESKRAALLGARRFDEAIDAYNDMFAKFDEFPDHDCRKKYVSPPETIEIIRISIKENQRDSLLILINTETGLLRDLNGRTADFEADIVYKELVASVMRHELHRIDHVVQQYFQYATFSHTWGWSEPLFQDVQNKSVHELEKSPRFAKLTMFCRMALDARLRWAWSDTCCINKLDSPVLQESLTSMYKWYHNSALTVVHLMGVPSKGSSRSHKMSLEYARLDAARIFRIQDCQIYTDDWQIYLPDETTYNHKESAAIMAEMAAATNVDAQVLLSLRLGPNNVRQKLCLAATRIATKQEDIAYSLFGIFNVFLSVKYGEGQQRALGRLLSEVLNLSRDATILAWTGRASEYNSCLPAEITVYSELPSPYTPSPIDDDVMEQLVATLQTSFESAVVLYDHVIRLRSPRLSGRLLRLPCIMFPLQPLPAGQGEPRRVYRAAIGGLGNVEIKTTEDLSTFQRLFLVHPWLQDLTDPAPPDMFDIATGPSLPLHEDDGHENATTYTTLGPSSSQQHRLNKRMRALRFFARLRQPFGRLLPSLSNREFKRVASDHLITAQLLQNVTLDQLVRFTRAIDVI